MAHQKTVFLPSGYTLELITDAVSSGTYTRLGNPGGTVYSPSDLAASSDTTIGPFNEPRDYVLDIAAGDISYVQDFSGLFTGADDSGKRPVVDTITSYPADGAISVSQGIARLTKSATAGAYTLAAPVAADEGKTIVLVNTVAKAHIVTATGLLDDGVTGGSKNTATFAAFAGSALTLMAIGLKWTVVSKNVVTIA